MSDKRYLADGVYADWDGHHVVITTEDGISVTNTIYIDADVWGKLVEWAANLGTHTVAEINAQQTGWHQCANELSAALRGEES